MFWKKKTLATSLSTLYRCLGPDYLRENTTDPGNSFDEQKEKLFACIQNRELSYEDINALNERYPFDLWNGMVWLEGPQLKEQIVLTENTCYRLKGINHTLDETVSAKIMEYFNFHHFYYNSDIIVVSEIAGADLMLECSWEKYTKRSLKVENIVGEIVYYIKAPKTLMNIFIP